MSVVGKLLRVSKSIEGHVKTHDTNCRDKGSEDLAGAHSATEPKVTHQDDEDGHQLEQACIDRDTKADLLQQLTHIEDECESN